MLKRNCITPPSPQFSNSSQFINLCIFCLFC